MGSLGHLYHTYGFLESAASAYLIASLLHQDAFEWNYSVAVIAGKQGDLHKALEYHKRALAVADENQPYLANIRIGETYQDLKDLENAESSFLTALALYAEGPAVYARLGELYLAKKEYEKAVEHLTHALALEPAINQLHYPLGLAYRGLGNRELAMHHMSLRGTVKVQPADPLQEKLASLLRGYRGHVTEGRLALTAGRYEKAATSFRKAIDEDPTRATVWRLLAQTDLQLERPEEALANLKEALRLDPEDLIAHALIGDVFIDLGESDKAIIHLKKFARANQQDATVTYKLAWALANNGRFEESIDYYEKSLALDPTRAVIWLEFITMLKNMSDHKLALAKSVLAAEKLPGEPTILANLVLAYAHSPDKQVRDGEKAVEVAKRLYHMESDFETARLVAISYAENDQCDKAVEWIDKTISMAKASMQGDFDLLIQACCRIEWQSQA